MEEKTLYQFSCENDARIYSELNERVQRDAVHKLVEGLPLDALMWMFSERFETFTRFGQPMTRTTVSIEL